MKKVFHAIANFYWQFISLFFIVISLNNYKILILSNPKIFFFSWSRLQRDSPSRISLRLDTGLTAVIFVIASVSTYSHSTVVYVWPMVTISSWVASAHLFARLPHIVFERIVAKFATPIVMPSPSLKDAK